MNYLHRIFSFSLLVFYTVGCKSTTSPESFANPYPATMEVYIGSAHSHLEEGVEGRQVYNWSKWSDGIHYYEKIAIGQLPQNGYIPNDYIPPTLTLSFLSDWSNTTKSPNVDPLYWVGSYNFAHSTDSGTGVMIHWIDATGKIWDSNFGSGDQTGSKFFIENFLPIDYQPFQGSQHFTRLTKGYFSCTLYDGFGGNLQMDSVRFSFINGWRTAR